MTRNQKNRRQLCIKVDAQGCKYFVWPKHNAEFWEKKIRDNAERDKKNYKKLEEQGWKVLTIWECGLKDAKDETLQWLEKQLVLR
jgi:DNA mismatch endonuclease (patch repair protein)